MTNGPLGAHIETLPIPVEWRRVYPGAVLVNIDELCSIFPDMFTRYKDGAVSS